MSERITKFLKANPAKLFEGPIRVYLTPEENQLVEEHNKRILENYKGPGIIITGFEPQLKAGRKWLKT